MKRVDLIRAIEEQGCKIRAIEEQGCKLVRHGGKHDWYRNPMTGVNQAVPRHREIKEPLARRIIRMLSNPDEGSAESEETR